MIPAPITDAAQTILARLDTAYAGIDPTDRAAVDAFWIALFEIYTGATEKPAEQAAA